MTPASSIAGTPLVGGAAEGPLLGGNLSLLTRLLGTCGFKIEAMLSVGGAAYRLATDFVSLAHLAYSLVRRQPSWTWADVEADRGNPLMRIYASVFPVLLRIARLGAMPRGTNGATLLVKARALTKGDGPGP